MSRKDKTKIPSVSIIVVNHNGKQYLKTLLDSLFSLNYPKNKLETIIVDNCSKDGSSEYVKNYFPKIKIVKNDINNYCLANNMGIKIAKGQFIALINNDVKIDKNWLVELIGVINENRSIGAVTGKILFPDGRIQGTGHHELPNFYWSDRGFKEEEKLQYENIEEITSISHCAALYRRECFDDVGLLDEDFNMFLEDVDMSIRAKQKGWKLFYVPKSFAYHKFHGSAGEELVKFYCERNRLLLTAKHFPEQFSQALYGKGYFTALNGSKKNELTKVLGDVFATLIKHHDNDVAISLLPGIFKSLSKIFNLEKDYMIEQLDSMKQNVSQKELNISQREKEISNLNEKISRLISQNDYLITQKDKKLSERESVIRQKNSEISSLNEKIHQIYSSETYRFIALPLWNFLDFIKHSKIIPESKKVKDFSRYNGDFCLAFFSAQTKIAKHKDSNLYSLKLTNDYHKPQYVKAKIEILLKEDMFVNFSKFIEVRPKSSLEVLFNYDWQEKAIWSIEGINSVSDEFWNRGFDDSDLYCIRASLINNTNTIIDSLDVYQKLIL